MSYIKNIIFIYTLEMPSLLPIIITCDRSYKTQCPGCHPNYIILSGVEFRYWQFLKFSRWFQRIAQFRKETEKNHCHMLGNFEYYCMDPKPKIKQKQLRKQKLTFQCFSNLAVVILSNIIIVLNQIIQLNDWCVNLIKWSILLLQIKKTKEAWLCIDTIFWVFLFWILNMKVLLVIFVA